jgi:phage-related protein
MGRNFARRLAFLPSSCEEGYRTGALRGTTRRDGSGCQASEGFGGASVLEIVTSYRGDAWRAVYSVRFQDAIYVLHAFQKKSTRGISTPAREVELIRERLTDAERDHKERQREK